MTIEYGHEDDGPDSGPQPPDKYSGYYKLGYQDALVWNIGPKDRKGIEAGYEDSYADGYEDGRFKRLSDEEDGLSA
jgi:hypothetical protein